jgi:hypothetical protein
MKDELQEVSKGDKWLRRHLSFPGNLCLSAPERHLCPQAMQKNL